MKKFLWMAAICSLTRARGTESVAPMLAIPSRPEYESAVSQSPVRQ